MCPVSPPPQFLAPSTPFLTPCPLWGPFGPSQPGPARPVPSVCRRLLWVTSPAGGALGERGELKALSPALQSGERLLFFLLRALLSGLSLVGTILGVLAGCCWSRRLLVLAGLSDAFRDRYLWHCLAQTRANKFLCADPVEKDRANCQPAPTNP